MAAMIKKNYQHMHCMDIRFPNIFFNISSLTIYFSSHKPSLGWDEPNESKTAPIGHSVLKLCALEHILASIFIYKILQFLNFVFFLKTKIKNPALSCTRDTSCESSPKILANLVHLVLRYRGTRKSTRCFEKNALQVSVLLHAHLNFLI